jgi:hypothetical protein
VHVARMLEMNNAYKFLVETLLGKRPHGWPRCRGRIVLEWILGK